MLWIGTTTGLYQFDGLRFEAFEPPPGVILPALSVSALLPLPDGGLWIGYHRPGVSVLARGHVVSYGRRRRRARGNRHRARRRLGKDHLGRNNDRSRAPPRSPMAVNGSGERISGRHEL